jgi:hypothetical protein
MVVTDQVDMKTRRRLYCIVEGGLAFWLPAIALSAVFQQHTSVLWLNIVSLSGLVALAILDRIDCIWAIRWNWVLAGVYILGPVSILTEAVFFWCRPTLEGWPKPAL